MGNQKRVVLTANYSVIEPLFALYLLGTIRDHGHVGTFFPVRKQNGVYDYESLYKRVEEFKATDVGFNVYSGNHVNAFNAADELRRNGIVVHIGGPHATYFAERCLKHADYVYKGQSFDSFGAYLDDKVPEFVKETIFHKDFTTALETALLEYRKAEGIINKRELLLRPDKVKEIEDRVRREVLEQLATDPKKSVLMKDADKVRILFRDYLSDTFPKPDRKTFYRDNPDMLENPIKNSICGEGCPFACTYCYNVAWNAPEMYGKFKRRVVRETPDVVDELKELKGHKTQMVYFQDDVFANEPWWVRQFMPVYKKEVGIPFHAQLRLELAVKEVGRERLKLMKEGGCTGLSVAIEHGIFEVRRDILDRPMENRDIFEGCNNIKNAGLKLRTFQILGVPTSEVRAGGSVLKADLETLLHNTLVNPVSAWASILVPYGGTELGKTVVKQGLYPAASLDTNDDLSDSFFDESILAYSVLYKKQVRTLQRFFSLLSHQGRGASMAQRFLEDALPGYRQQIFDGFIATAKQLAIDVKLTEYDSLLYETKDEEAYVTSAGIPIVIDSRVEKPATGARRIITLDDLAQARLSGEQLQTLNALRPLLNVPRGEVIASKFMKGFNHHAPEHRDAFLGVVTDLGSIARQEQAKPALDLQAEMVRISDAEDVRLGRKTGLRKLILVQ